MIKLPVSWMEYLFIHHALASAVGVFFTVFGLLAAMSTNREKSGFLYGLWLALGLIGATAGPASLVWFELVVDQLAMSGRYSSRRLAAAVQYPFDTWAACAFLGFAVWWFLYRWWPAHSEGITAKLTKKTSVAREGRTDIRTIEQQLPKSAKPYDPRKYFRQGRIFVGLNERKQPQYVDYEDFRCSHSQLMGTTGAGKGVAAGVLIVQAMAHGEAVVVVDPKDDEWCPHLCRREAERLGRPFVLIDLRIEAPQFNLIAGATAGQVEELLVAGLGLSDKGDSADHHRVADRSAAHTLAQLVIPVNPTATLADLYEAGIADPQIMEDAKGLMRRLGEIVSGDTVCGLGGPDFAELIKQGACIYIIGSMRHGRILAIQRMLMVRLCQIAESRDRVDETPRQVLIFLDELKAHISRPALEMLGAIRDKGAHVIIAHQSLGDLRDCPKDLNPDAVVDAVSENCSIRVAYRVRAKASADWLAEATGKILIDEEARKVERNAALVEQATGERTVREGQTERLESNVFLSLPKRVAVVFAPGLLEPVHVEPLKVRKAKLERAQAQPRPASIATKAAAPGIDLDAAPQVIEPSPTARKKHFEPVEIAPATSAPSLPDVDL